MSEQIRDGNYDDFSLVTLWREVNEYGEGDDPSAQIIYESNDVFGLVALWCDAHDYEDEEDADTQRKKSYSRLDSIRQDNLTALMQGFDNTEFEIIYALGSTQKKDIMRKYLDRIDNLAQQLSIYQPKPLS